MGILPLAELETVSRRQIAQRDITPLRHLLLQLHAWPEGGDLYLDLLPQTSGDAQPVSEEDLQWLVLAARDAIQGYDIGAKYPAFFQKLLTHTNLQARFLSEIKRQM